MDQDTINALAQSFAKAIADAGKPLGFEVGQKSPATAPSGTWIHGPGGLFAGAVVDKRVISLRIAPQGISSVLRAFPSVETNPQYGYITGFRDDGDSEPSDECSTCASTSTKTCVQTAQFGRFCRETKTMTLRRAIERVNRGDIDYQLVNDIFGPEYAQSFFRGPSMMDKGRVMQLAVAWAMVEAGVGLQNVTHPITWTGNPANNNGTGYMEFPGLDILIGTNKVDAITGDQCYALDSDVKNFGYNLVSATDASGNYMIVRYLEYMEAYLYHNAVRQSLSPASWVIAMRPELWYELSMIWPTAWMSTRNITMKAGNTTFIDSTRVREMVEEMQRSMTIWINGRQHRVVLDDGIFEYTNVNDGNVPAGTYASNIYFVPVSFLGGQNATFYEHLDYRVGREDQALARLQQEFWTDDGRFLWTNERTKFCFTISGEIRPRIVLLTPQLAGRINYVRYSPEQHFRSYDEDSDYFFDGGVYERPSPSLYSDWNMPEE
jgi:hypothetical protein